VPLTTKPLDASDQGQTLQRLGLVSFKGKLVLFGRNHRGNFW